MIAKTLALSYVAIYAQHVSFLWHVRTIAESGISADAVVQVLYSINRIECSSKDTAGCDVEDLRVVDIPQTATFIRSFAFSGRTSLASITIPDSVTEIEDLAFYECCSLVSVIIPDSVAEIGDAPLVGACL